MLKRRKQLSPPSRRRSNLADRPATPAFSYYTQRSERDLNTGRQAGRIEQPPESRAMSAVRYMAQRGGLLILLVAAAILLISSVSLNTKPRIIPLSGALSRYFLHSTLTYQQAASDILSSSVWNRNKLTINTAAISGRLKAKFPELAQVTITLPLLSHRPVIYVQPSTPALILHAANGSFVVSDTGKVLLATTQLPPDSRLSLPVVTDQTNLHAQLSKQILTSSDVRFVEIVTAELQARHIAISGMALPQAASELDVRFTGQPYFAKFNMQPGPSDARQQAGTFIAVEDKLASEHITPGAYIDVRIDGRAYYK